MQNKLRIYSILGAVALLLLFFVSILSGFYTIELESMGLLLRNIFSSEVHPNPTDAYIFYEVRLPRTIMGIVMGCGLAISGASLQGMFKNPLATPSIIGITSGAALFAAISIVLGSSIKAVLPEYFHYMLLSLAAFLGAILVMFLVYNISFKDGKTHVVIMLLAGVAISALAEAITGYLTFISNEEELRDLTFWRLGSLGAANWNKVGILTLITGISCFFLLKNGKALNAMMLGEENAQHLGINIKRHHAAIIWFSSLIVGTSVAFAGTIGFVGLIVPYILRLLIRSDYRVILPLSALYGSVLLLGADIFSRTFMAPVEIPIGVITATMGAPVFIMILIRFKKSL